MLALALVLLVILGGVNAMSYYRTVVRMPTRILTILARKPTVVFPQPRRHRQQYPQRGAPRQRQRKRARQLSPETPYESRFFSVSLERQRRRSSSL